MNRPPLTMKLLYFHEELLSSEILTIETTGQSIFSTLITFFDKHRIPLINVCSCSTDSASSMTGHKKGCISLLRKEIDHDILHIHGSSLTFSSEGIIGLFFRNIIHNYSMCQHC